MKHLVLKGLAAAAGLALAAVGSPASASYLVHLNSSQMDGTYHAVINYDDNVLGLHIHEEALSNGVTFNVTNLPGPAGGTGTFGSYFAQYKAVTGPGARVFTLSDTTSGLDTERVHQGFVVGWPAVPEPATWAMMIMGFMGTGVALRRRKAALA